MEHLHAEGKRRGTLSSLFVPPDPSEVLIKSETILYNERKHWAILIQPFLETLAGLILLTVLAGDRQLGFFGFFVVLTTIAMSFFWFRNKQWNRGLTYFGIAGLILGYVIFGRQVLAVLAVLAITTRFGYRFMKWAFFDRLYITNRRILHATGFLGSNIDTMPLTRVTDISYNTTIPAEIFRYALLRVESAGQEQALSRINYLDKPETFYDILIDRSTAAVGSVTPEELPDEIGVLDEDDGSGTLQP